MLDRDATAEISQTPLSLSMPRDVGKSETVGSICELGLRDVLKRGLDAFGGDALRLGDRRGDDGVMCEQVGLAEEAARELEDRLDARRLKARKLGAGEAKPVGEVRRHLVAHDATDVSADDGALREPVEIRETHAPTALGMPDADDGASILGIHHIVGQQPEIFEPFGAEMMRLIDEENRTESILGAEARDLSANLAEERGTISLGREAEARMRSTCRGPSRCRSSSTT